MGIGGVDLTAKNVKTAVSWDVAPCSLVDIDRRFRAHCIIIDLMVEEVSSSEMSVNIC
jgi:hypothetical protein